MSTTLTPEQADEARAGIELDATAPYLERIRRLVATPHHIRAMRAAGWSRRAAVGTALSWAWGWKQ